MEKDIIFTQERADEIKGFEPEKQFLVFCNGPEFTCMKAFNDFEDAFVYHGELTGKGAMDAVFVNRDSEI